MSVDVVFECDMFGIVYGIFCELLYELWCSVEVCKDIPSWLSETTTWRLFVSCCDYSVDVCHCVGWTICRILLTVHESPKKFIRAVCHSCYLLGAHWLKFVMISDRWGQWLKSVWKINWLTICVWSIRRSWKSLDRSKLLFINLKYWYNIHHCSVSYQKLWRVLLIF